MKYDILIALRFLKESRGRGFISRISLIAFIIVSLSVFVPLVVMSIVNGFHDSVLLKHMNKDYHIQISRGNLYDVERLSEKIKQIGIEDKIKIMVPFYLSHGLIKGKDSRYFGVIIRFASKDSYKEDDSLRDNFKIISGKYGLNSKFSIVIGEALARRFSKDEVEHREFLKLVDEGAGPVLYLLVSREKGLGGIEYEAFSLSDGLGGDEEEDGGDMGLGNLSTYRLKVVGVYRSGYEEYDKSLVFSNLKTGELVYNARIKLRGKSYPLLTGLGLKLYRVEDVDKVSLKLNEHLLGYRVSTWEVLNGHLIYAFKWEERIMAVILFIIVLFSVVITVYINLNIIVLDKRREIGILKTFGVRSSRVEKVFTIYGYIIGFVGCSVGILFGILLVLSLNDIIKLFEVFYNMVLGSVHNYMGWEGMYAEWRFFSGTLGHLDDFEYKLNLKDMYLLVFLGILVSVGGAYFSVRRRLRKSISDSLKYK